MTVPDIRQLGRELKVRSWRSTYGKRTHFDDMGIIAIAPREILDAFVAQLKAVYVVGLIADSGVMEPDIAARQF